MESGISGIESRVASTPTTTVPIRDDLNGRAQEADVEPLIADSDPDARSSNIRSKVRTSTPSSRRPKWMGALMAGLRPSDAELQHTIAMSAALTALVAQQVPSSPRTSGDVPVNAMLSPTANDISQQLQNLSSALASLPPIPALESARQDIIKKIEVLAKKL